MLADSEGGVLMANVLSTLSGPPAFTSLVEGLGDADSDIRSSAAAALGELGDARAIDPLVTLVLVEQNLTTFQAATGALKKLDQQRVTGALLKGLDDDETSIRQAAARALREVAWEHLDGPQKARLAIAQNDWAEAASLGPAAIEPLRAALTERTGRCGAGAANALGRIGTTEAIDVLSSLLGDLDLDQTTREAVAVALGRFCASDLTDTQQARICIVLGQWSDVVTLGAAAVEPLADVVSGGFVRDRERAVSALATIGGHRAFDVLAAALTDPGQEVVARKVVARSLGEVCASRTIPAVTAALRDQAWEVRTSAAGALQHMGWSSTDEAERALFFIAKQNWDEVESIGTPAVEYLIETLQYASISADAARVLVRIGPDGVDALVELIGDRDRPAAVREVAATALAEVGDTRAIEPLTNMLNDSDMTVRQSAVWTLERFGWQPTDDNQRATAAIAHDDWKQVRRLGAAAVEPLLVLATNTLAPHATASALEHILKTTAPRVSIDQLRTIIYLCDFDQYGAERTASSSDRRAAAVAADYARVRRLARLELIRRGVMF